MFRTSPCTCVDRVHMIVPLRGVGRHGLRSESSCPCTSCVYVGVVCTQFGGKLGEFPPQKKKKRKKKNEDRIAVVHNDMSNTHTRTHTHRIMDQAVHNVFSGGSLALDRCNNERRSQEFMQSALKSASAKFLPFVDLDAVVVVDGDVTRLLFLSHSHRCVAERARSAEDSSNLDSANSFVFLGKVTDSTHLRTFQLDQQRQRAPLRGQAPPPSTSASPPPLDCTH